MSYDDWKTTEPPTWIETEADEARMEQMTLRYRDEVTQDLLQNVEEYLTFSSVRQLCKLIADNL